MFEQQDKDSTCKSRVPWRCLATQKIVGKKNSESHSNIPILGIKIREYSRKKFAQHFVMGLYLEKEQLHTTQGVKPV